MANWKYKLGDSVTPIMAGNYEQVGMVITARVTEEYEHHVEQYYVCSAYRMGEFVRQRLLESEITLCKP